MSWHMGIPVLPLRIWDCFKWIPAQWPARCDQQTVGVIWRSKYWVWDGVALLMGSFSVKKMVKNPHHQQLSQEKLWDKLSHCWVLLPYMEHAVRDTSWWDWGSHISKSVLKSFDRKFKWDDTLTGNNSSREINRFQALESVPSFSSNPAYSSQTVWSRRSVHFFFPEDTTNSFCFKLWSNKRNLTTRMFVANYVTYVFISATPSLNPLAIIIKKQFGLDFTTL